MTELVALTTAESTVLADCEQRIERGLKTFVEVGSALAMIRDNRLYRATHGTFELYCQARWGMGRDYADRMIVAAQVVPTIVSNGLPAPTRESQARELARVPEEDRAEVWRETVEATDGKPTAAAIRETYERTQTPAPARRSYQCFSCDRRFEAVDGENRCECGGFGTNAQPITQTPASTPEPAPATDVDPPARATNPPPSRAGEPAPVAEPATDPTTPGADGQADPVFRGTGQAGEQDGPAVLPSPPVRPEPDDVESESKPERKQPNRRPLPDAFQTTAWDLVKVAERLDRLAADDRFPRNAEQVARMSRSDLLRAVDLLATVIDRLPPIAKES